MSFRKCVLDRLTNSGGLETRFLFSRSLSTPNSPQWPMSENPCSGSTPQLHSSLSKRFPLSHQLLSSRGRPSTARPFTHSLSHSRTIGIAAVPQTPSNPTTPSKRNPDDLVNILSLGPEGSKDDDPWKDVDATLPDRSTDKYLHSVLPPITSQRRWEDYSKERREMMAAIRSPAGKYAGRSFAVNRFVSVAAALGRLNRTLSNNNVRQELRLVERYEKPTDKRRRLKSERHRRRFADMVRAFVVFHCPPCNCLIDQPLLVCPSQMRLLLNLPSSDCTESPRGS
jgi:ribosomal protein S21